MVYLIMGCADCVRGLLAFVACPLFGKLSDQLGRRLCLFVTVAGTCAPVCALAVFYLVAAAGAAVKRENPTLVALKETWSSTGATTATTESLHHSLPPPPPYAITVFVILLSLSGVFSSTFTLVFAYINDTVPQRKERVSAYGLALATFGLSFTIGPMAGGYLVSSGGHSEDNPQQDHSHYVFGTSLILTLLDLLYIFFILPESKTTTALQGTFSSDASVTSTTSASIQFLQQTIQAELSTWHPWDAVRIVVQDPFLKHVGHIAFLYYTGLWAVISTLSLYAVQHFHLTPERLGELMSALGFSTMIAEAVLVRIIVPRWGEVQATRLGLLSFAAQCFVLGFAYESWHLFICVAFSLLGNLVYPSLSSLVSSVVEPNRAGEALGALNGVKALTEGIGPLVFGALMTVSEKSAFPGWPYWIAAALVLLAYDVADRKLPDDHKHPGDGDWNDYVHELELKPRRRRRRRRDGSSLSPKYSKEENEDEDEEDVVVGCWNALSTSAAGPGRGGNDGEQVEDDEEYQDLLPALSLSEVEESSDDNDGQKVVRTKK